MNTRKSIVILDFGGQYAHLIASRVRRFGVFSEIKPAETPASELKHAAGIILSGGPASVYDEGSPQGDPAIFELGIPVMGLCYGLHWMTQALGGEVKAGKVKEYGRTEIEQMQNSDLLSECPGSFTVWMSHGDEAATLPPGFELIATSDACKNAAFADAARHFYALQFHPEVTHSEHGLEILQTFVSLCEADEWSMTSYVDYISQQIADQVGDRKVFVLVSGGVDSTVAFTLLNRVLGPERVQGLLVDHGLMRKNEVEMIRQAFADLGVTNLRIEDASEEFFAKLAGVCEPERKRQIIGQTFLDVQKRVSEEMGMSMESGWMLGQGTIYPDTIETGNTKHADKIKTHHNQIDAIQEMTKAGLVIEPLIDLYKDEVRLLGEQLGLPHDLVWRQPFPGPGLGVRILCRTDILSVHEQQIRPGSLARATQIPHAVVLPIHSVGVQGDGRTYRQALALFSEAPCDPPPEYWELSVQIPNQDQTFNRVLLCTSHPEPIELAVTPGDLNRDRADLLREADAIADEEMRAAGLYQDIWQFPVVLLPVGTSDGGQSVVLRPIASTDAMTANAFALPPAVLQTMTDRIMALPGIDAVFFDMTNKPPGTIEWE